MKRLSGMSARMKVSSGGRISIPAAFRKRNGIEDGNTVIYTDKGDVLEIRTVSQGLARAKAIARELVADRDDVSVDDFLAGRRREAEWE
jgi:AbrB family looped-hinge helix DNA binding protein